MQQANDTKTQTLPLAAAIPEGFQFVALDLIDAENQVRTESGLDDSLDDLAESIRQHGVLEPVLLRPAAERFILIGGHRRTFAARLAGLEVVPAIVRRVDEQLAFELQLAENIQREDLSLAELAAAVRRLFDKHQDLAKVGAIVKKSKPWVSKHLAASCPEFSWRARQLLESGEVQDIDLLGTINQIDKLGIGWHELDALLTKIKQRKAGRTEARKVLEELKAKKAQLNKDAKQAKRAKAKATPAPIPAWSASAELANLHDAVLAPTVDIDELLKPFSVEQIAKMELQLEQWHKAGTEIADGTPIVKMRAIARMVSDYPDNDDLAAFIVGAAGMRLTLRDVLVELQQIYSSK